ncbi:MAG: M12 family metallopeptidase [Methylocella sp.]
MRKTLFGAVLLLLWAGMAPPSVAQDQSRRSAADAPPRPSQMRTGIYRGHNVTYGIIDGKPIFEGDIILDHVTELAPGQPPANRPSVGIAYPQYFWPKNSKGVAGIPFIITSGATNLAAALNQFNATFKGIIQFGARTTQADYVNFNFDPNNHNGTCESIVGRAGGEQETGGSVDCNLGTLLHEMGHIVGLYHEHSRPDRNSYVTVSYANMIKGSKANFDQLIDNYQDLGLYDYGSVMHYIAFAFSRNGGPVIESIPAGIPLSNLTGYTAADIDGVQRLYGAAPKSVTIATNPPGLTVTIDGTNYKTPQAFNWVLNSTHTLAVPAAAQTLAGATYVYARWNDSPAASHTIKINPGNKTLALPATSPAITVYTANFIKLASYTATVAPAGAGTVSASPLAKSYPGASGVFYVERQQVTLSADAATGYSFLEWGGVSAPWSANPKANYVPENSGAYNVTGDFSTKPVTTVTTNPPGLGLYVDGTFWYGPQSFASDYFSSWTPGSTHTVSSYTPQLPYSINSRYAFLSWSDSGTLTHTIVAPGTNTTFTASFTPQFVPIAYATPSCAASVALAPGSSDGFYSKGSIVTVTATPASGWVLTSWLDDLTGTANPQNLTINDEELAVANYDTTATALAITSLTPVSLTKGSAGQTLSITGAGFTPSSIVFINNVFRTSQFVSATQINVNLMSTDLATPGAFPVAVSNFPSGAPCSAYMAQPFFITTP